MKLIELLAYIQLYKKEKFGVAELAQVLNVSRQNIDKMKDRDLTPAFIERVENSMNIDILSNMRDTYFVPYWEGVKDFPNIKSPLLRNLSFDKEFIHNIWKKNHNDLRLIRMIGDELDGGTYNIRHGDILLFTLKEKSLNASGVYVYTTETNGVKNLYISGVRQCIDGNYKFFFTNPTYEGTDKIYSVQQMQEMKLSVIGRVLVDLSKTI